MKKLQIPNGTICNIFSSSTVKDGNKTFRIQLNYGKKALADYHSIMFKGINPEDIESSKNAVEVEVRDGALYKDGNCIFNRGSLIVNQIADLVKEGNRIVARFDDLILAEFTEDEFTEGLFLRRNNFKLAVKSDDDYKVIRYANLHQHTEYSLLDGMARVKDVAKKAEYACAITDHGNMYGHRAFYEAMVKAGKKPIIGFEAYIETLNDDEKPKTKADFELYKRNNFNGNHLILLAKNNVGLKNLYKLTTEGYNNIYGHPHITYELLEKYHEGLICTSACLGGPICEAIKNQDMEMVERVILKLKELFGDDFYVEIQDHKFEEETAVMQMAKVFAKKYGVKLTVGIDAHYVNPEDSEAHELWLCNLSKKTINDPTRFKFTGEGYYMMSSEEVVELFKDIPEALDNTLEIADKCNVKIEFEGYHLPDFDIPKEYKTQAEYFTQLCRDGYKRLFYGTDKFRDPVYVNRMKEEIKVITGMHTGTYNPNADWSGYLLIVQDFINYAKSQGIYCGPGRGSAAGSLVAYCLGITNVDPISDGLLFER